MQRARKVAKRYDEEIKATDLRFNHVVRITHEEGTTYWFENAFLVTWKDSKTTHEWVIAITEHQGYHVFNKEELNDYGQYTRVGPSKISGLLNPE